MEACEGSFCDVVESGLADNAFCCVCGAADESAGCIKEAIRLLQEDASCYPQPSESRKKFTLKKTVGKLTKACDNVEGIKVQMMHLREQVHTLQEKLKATQEDHLEALNQMDAFAIDMQETLLRLREEEDEKNRLMQELEEANSSSETSRSKLEAREREHELRLKEHSKLSDDNAHLRSENERLNQTVIDQEMQLKESEAAQKNASKAVAQLDRFKEVVAKITADNMVFLMKLKQSEAALAVAQERISNMEEERAMWLEEASAEIEGAVRAGLGKSVESETELEVLYGERQRWENKVQESEERITKLVKSKERLEERLSALEDANTKLLHSLDEEKKQRHYAEAEARVLLNSLKQSNDELVEAQRKYDVASEELKTTSKSLAEKQEKMENLFVALKNSSLQLGTQQAINAAIMKKKEEMEWRCLEAEAQREKMRNKLKGRAGTN